MISKFSEILKLANTKEELEAIQSKMKQVEQEILTRVRPFELKNKSASQHHLKALDEAAFAHINTEVGKEKQDLKRYEELGENLDEYLSTMEDNDEWKRVSDADCMDFLLKAIPERLEHVNS